MVTKISSMKYPQFHQIPKDGTLRFLDPAQPQVIAFDLEDPNSYPNFSIRNQRGGLQFNPFNPFPSSFEHTMEEMNALTLMRARLRSMIDVVEIRMEAVPIPVRKKKSWLRYTSNKKWSRNFAKRLQRVVDPREVKVLSLPKELMDKINALASSNPLDAAFMNPRPKAKRRG
jgi:hypothetical protein